MRHVLEDEFIEIQNKIYEIPKFTHKNPLENTKSIWKELGRPCLRKKIVHVAGTNGKGSVTNYLSYLLEEKGYCVGLFTSPHLVSITERMKLNHQDIDRDLFAQFYEQLNQKLKIILDQNEQLSFPTFFEYIFLLALLYFESSKCEYLILETGMGGRLDATNIFQNPVLTVITKVGLDHCDYLGHTLEEVAFEKAGILKPGVKAICGLQKPEVRRVIEKCSESINCDVEWLDEQVFSRTKIEHKNIDFYYNTMYYNDVMFRINTVGLYQIENSALALKAFEILGGTKKSDIVCMKKALLKAKWPARMEEILPNVFLDGAHNEDGIACFVETISHLPCFGKRRLVFSAVSDKAYDSMLEMLVKCSLFVEIYVVELSNSRKVESSLLEHRIRQLGFKEISCYASVQEGFCEAVEKMKCEDHLYIVGSLYLAGEVKEYLLKKEEKNDKF